MYGDRNLREKIWLLAQEALFLKALFAAITAGVGSAVIKAINDPGYSITVPFLHKGFLDDVLPDGFVFNCFIVAISIVASFRTSFALSRFTDGSSCMHQMGSCYFEATSSLFAFSRVLPSTSDYQCLRFHETLVRLVSLMHALCLQELEEHDTKKPKAGFSYDIIDVEPVDQWFQDFVMEQSETKVEAVFQAIQCLIVENTNNGVLTAAPPILSRAFQELGGGLLKYHDGMKVVAEKTPLAYSIITTAILGASIIFVPLMLANSTRGALSACFLTFGFVFAVWFVYGVADSLDNPYQRRSHTIDAPRAQRELNDALLNLLVMRKQPVPYVRDDILKHAGRYRPGELIRNLHDWKVEQESRQNSKGSREENATWSTPWADFGDDPTTVKITQELDDIPTPKDVELKAVKMGEPPSMPGASPLPMQRGRTPPRIDTTAHELDTNPPRPVRPATSHSPSTGKTRAVAGVVGDRPRMDQREGQAMTRITTTSVAQEPPKSPPHRGPARTIETPSQKLRSMAAGQGGSNGMVLDTGGGGLHGNAVKQALSNRQVHRQRSPDEVHGLQTYPGHVPGRAVHPNDDP